MWMDVENPGAQVAKFSTLKQKQSLFTQMQSCHLSLQHYNMRSKTLYPLINSLDAIIKECKEDLEGNCFYHGAKQGEEWQEGWFFLLKRMNLINCIRDFNIEKICEIGLNGGHSAACFLQALPITGSMVFFDLCEHKYTKKVFDHLKTHFPQIKELVEGDSTKTLSIWVDTHKDELDTFDLVHVDGGHFENVPYSDVFYADKLLRPGGFMILDDTQLEKIMMMIPYLMSKGYTMPLQTPTFCLSHVFLQKSFEPVSLT